MDVLKEAMLDPRLRDPLPTDEQALGESPRRGRWGGVGIGVQELHEPGKPDRGARGVRNIAGACARFGGLQQLHPGSTILQGAVSASNAEKLKVLVVQTGTRFPDLVGSLLQGGRDSAPYRLLPTKLSVSTADKRRRNIR